MDYNYPIYTYNFPNQTSSSKGAVITSVILFLVVIILIAGFVIYLIYYKKSDLNITEESIIFIPEVKLPQSDLNIEDELDESCIQKRKIYDSDFDRTIYPIDDNEIIYF